MFYIVAALATTVAVLVRRILDPWLGNELPVATLYAAVGFTMWLCGTRPALMVVVVGYLTCEYLFAEPLGRIGIVAAHNLVGLFMYLISCGILLCIGAEMRRANRRLESQQKKTEEALHRSEEQLSIVADCMAALVTRCSSDLRYLWVSKSYAEWLGRSADEIIGAPIADVLGPEAFECLQPHCQRVLSGQKVVYEELLNCLGIGRRWIHGVHTPTFDRSGRTDGWVAVVTDITERKHVEESLHELDRRKNEFLATLAHELRNPLAPVLNATQIMRFAGPASPEVEYARDVIERQLQHMTRLIDDLLDVSRISRNKIELRRENVVLARILQGAVETSRPLIDSSSHQLSVTLPNEPLHLSADVTRLAQVFSNLLTNAAKYTPRGGRISMSAERRANDVFVTVKDNGVGIPRHMLDRIFDMFTQVDRSLESAHSGLGIGLTLARRLVEMHDGSIEAHSDGIGCGSEFVVRLPISSAFESDVVTSTDDAVPFASSQRRVLIVDDNRDVLVSSEMMLSFLGYQTRVAGDGVAALEEVEDFLPHIVLLDIGMPKLNGYQVARRIREQPWGRDVTLIALTGWGQAEDKQRANEAGFDYHLVKPVCATTLARLLASLPKRELLTAE